MRLMSLFLLSFYISTSISYADVIDIVGEGASSVTIVSDDGDSVIFRDRDGRERTIPKSKVTFYDRETPVDKITVIKNNTEQKVKNVVNKAKSAASKIKLPTTTTASAKPEKEPKKTKKQKEMDQATSILNQQTEASKALYKQQRKVSKALKEALGEATGGSSSSKSSGSGRFRSLSD